MNTDPLIELLTSASKDPVGTVARAFGYLQPTLAVNPAGYFAGVGALAMSIRESQPAFAFALAEYVAENGDPVRGARLAIRLRAASSGQDTARWSDLHEAVRKVPKSNVHPESVAADLHLYLPAVAAATRIFRGGDPLGLRLGALYCLGQLRFSPRLAEQYEDLLLALVEFADRGSIRSWLQEASHAASLEGLGQALRGSARP